MYAAEKSEDFPVTVCAVAQHCYNGDVSFLWENGNFDPPVFRINVATSVAFRIKASRFCFAR